MNKITECNQSYCIFEINPLYLQMNYKKFSKKMCKNDL